MLEIKAGLSWVTYRLPPDVVRSALISTAKDLLMSAHLDDVMQVERAGGQDAVHVGPLEADQLEAELVLWVRAPRTRLKQTNNVSTRGFSKV